MSEFVTKSLQVTICQDAQEAIDKGYQYGADYAPLQITSAVIVRNGTESGKPTVDLILKDADGNKYVAMLTGALLKSIPC